MRRKTPLSVRRVSLTTAAVLAAGVVTVGVAQAISGGTTVPEGTYPFIARITLDTKACSGVLVDPSWVLTSAACLTPSISGAPTQAATVAVGNVNLATGAGHVTKITKVVRRTDRDVVLAKLQDAATGVQPIVLSTAAPQAGETLQVTGFGRATTEWVPNRPRVAPFTVSAVTATTAALTSADGADTCKGDAGGPAFRVVNGRAELVTLNSASWQHGCLDSSETRQGSTGVRVDDLSAWVQKQVVPTQVTCPAGAVIWAERPNGDLARYVHHSVADGGLNWTTPSAAIGSGWRGRMVAAPGGVVWDFHRNNGSGDAFADGTVKRWVWNGSSWSGGQQVGSGWERYLTAEYRNRLTIDEKGRIYMINDLGELRVFIWNEATGSWVNGVGDVLDNGWAKFNSITAAGDGVLYSRDTNGNLFRFKYDFAVKAWTQKDAAAGVGWQMFSEIFSPGGDILYGRGSQGPSPWGGATGPVLRWYQHFDNTDTWAPAGPDGAGKPVGTGWDTETHISAEPNSCSLVP